MLASTSACGYTRQMESRIFVFWRGAMFGLCTAALCVLGVEGYRSTVARLLDILILSNGVIWLALRIQRRPRRFTSLNNPRRPLRH